MLPGGPQPKEPPPWWPHALLGAVRSPEKLRTEWQYVVVEEVVGATVELMRWPWPSADRYGRLVWDDEAEQRVMSASVPQRLMRLQLYKPNGLQRRPRAGDTFAARLTSREGWDADAPVDDLTAVLPGAVYDVSADARRAAKLAYQASTAAVFDGREARVLLEDAQERRESASRAKRLSVTPVQEVIEDEDDLA